MNLMQLVDEFDSETACREVLAELRWPDGVKCPRCQAERHAYDSVRFVWDCYSCGYQFSALSGTVFQDTKLPLRKWFMAVLLMAEAKKGMSANQMKRTIGVSYKTAWYLCHRIRSAMGSGEQRLLEGVVELDETYVGGNDRGRGNRGPQADKVIVAGAIERGGEVRMQVVNDVRRSTLRKFIEASVDLENTEAVYTDKLASYTGIHPNHGSVNHQRKEWVRGEAHTQTVENAWSLFKRSLVGSYHQLSPQHLDAYLDEFEWRFNNRDNDFLFRDTLTRLVTAEALTYSELVG